MQKIRQPYPTAPQEHLHRIRRPVAEKPKPHADAGRTSRSGDLSELMRATGQGPSPRFIARLRAWLEGR